MLEIQSWIASQHRRRLFPFWFCFVVETFFISLRLTPDWMREHSLTVMWYITSDILPFTCRLFVYIYCSLFVNVLPATSTREKKAEKQNSREKIFEPSISSFVIKCAWVPCVYAIEMKYKLAFDQVLFSSDFSFFFECFNRFLTNLNAFLESESQLIGSARDAHCELIAARASKLNQNMLLGLQS